MESLNVGELCAGEVEKARQLEVAYLNKIEGRGTRAVLTRQIQD